MITKFRMLCSAASAAVVVATGVTASAGADAQGTRAWRGAISEEQFKALHELAPGTQAELFGKMIELEGGTHAYLSIPPNAKAPMPGILVIHEWWGLNDHIKHWADRLAAGGYGVLAVDLYAGKVATTSDDAMKFMQAVDDAAARASLLAGHAFLKSDPRIAAPKRAVIGWCFGGGKALALAMVAPDLDACVMYYGFPVLDDKQLAAIKAPVLAIWGNKDDAIPPATVDEFDKALKTANVDHTFHRYDAVHAFANPSNPKYDQQAAADAWNHVQVFFKQKLR